LGGKNVKNGIHDEREKLALFDYIMAAQAFFEKNKQGKQRCEKLCPKKLEKVALFYYAIAT